MSNETTRIHVAAGEFDAQQVKAFLAAHDIPCEFRGEALRLTHGLTLDGLGEVEIHVAEELAERARALLARVAAGELTLDDSDDSTPLPIEPKPE